MSRKFPASLRDLCSRFFSKKSNRRAYTSLVVLLLIMLFGYQNCSNGFQVLEGTATLSSKSSDSSIPGACVSGTTQTCAFNNGLGTQTCNQEGTGFGQCQLTSCNPAFNFQNGVCIPNACAPGTVTNCAANNGTGTQTCNAQGTGPGACMITACNDGYRLANGQCEKIPPTKYFLDTYQGLDQAPKKLLYSLKDGLLKSQILLNNDPNSPSKVEISTGVTAFSNAYGTACAVVSGALKCWGNNISCKAGVNDGVYKEVATATTVIPSGVTDVSVGVLHTCAIANGSLQCFGDNKYGQLGNGLVTPPFTTVNDCGIKTVVASGVTAVSAAHTQTCAVVNGSAQCWGNSGSASDQGMGTTVKSLTPATLISSGVQRISAGRWGSALNTHACTIASNGALSCFGNSYFGQIGNGKQGFADGASAPPYVVFPSGVTDVSTGNLTTCAVVNSALKCWGVGYAWAYELPGAQLLQKVFDLPQTIIESGVSQIVHDSIGECAVVGKTLKCFLGDNKSAPTTHNLE